MLDRIQAWICQAFPDYFAPKVVKETGPTILEVMLVDQPDMEDCFWCRYVMGGIVSAMGAVVCYAVRFDVYQDKLANEATKVEGYIPIQGGRSMNPPLIMPKKLGRFISGTLGVSLITMGLLRMCGIDFPMIQNKSFEKMEAIKMYQRRVFRKED